MSWLANLDPDGDPADAWALVLADRPCPHGSGQRVYDAACCRQLRGHLAAHDWRTFHARCAADALPDRLTCPGCQRTFRPGPTYRRLHGDHCADCTEEAEEAEEAGADDRP